MREGGETRRRFWSEASLGFSSKVEASRGFRKESSLFSTARQGLGLLELARSLTWLRERLTFLFTPNPPVCLANQNI